MADTVQAEKEALVTELVSLRAEAKRLRDGLGMLLDEVDALVSAGWHHVELLDSADRVRGGRGDSYQI